MQLKMHAQRELTEQPLVWEVLHAQAIVLQGVLVVQLHKQQRNVLVLVLPVAIALPAQQTRIKTLVREVHIVRVKQVLRSRARLVIFVYLRHQHPLYVQWAIIVRRYHLLQRLALQANTVRRLDYRLLLVQAYVMLVHSVQLLVK